ncbi:MAG: hypothetical protein GF364_01195 [Candidatus Lokiarchaeota archaeon]|nr:hypothetical protein [Candidatus Lokiarchaeota archaeon]
MSRRTMQTSLEILSEKTQAKARINTSNNITPLGVEEFLEATVNVISFRKLKNDRALKIYKNTIVNLTSSNEADDIVQLYQDVYQGNYPYTEMLDLDYLEEKLKHPDITSLYAYRSKKHHNRIVGCGAVICDKESRTGYLRGLMLHPNYRDEIDIKKSVLKTLISGYNRFYDHIDKYYTETRTAHSKAQYLMELIGCRPCAIFPNKDIFEGKNIRETDCLDVVYTDRALYKYRNSYPILLPCFEELYRYFAERYGFEDAIFAEPRIGKYDFFSGKFMDIITKIFCNISVNRKECRYNRIKYKIQTESGSKIEFTVTETVKSAEKTIVNVNCIEDLAALLIKVDDIMKEDDIEYFECYIPATNPEIQSVFLQSGFSVFGYVPAWISDSGRQLNDCIIFGKYNTPLEMGRLRLTYEGNQLLNLLKPFLKK